MEDILIIEDDFLFRKGLENFTKKNFPDFSVKSFELVSEGKRYISENGFPLLVVTDYNMPEGEENGDVLIRWLKESSFNDLIAWTGNPDGLRKSIPEYEFCCIEKCEYDLLKGQMSKILKLVSSHK